MVSQSKTFDDHFSKSLPPFAADPMDICYREYLNAQRFIKQNAL